jgi:hypothetical protein
VSNIHDLDLAILIAPSAKFAFQTFMSATWDLGEFHNAIIRLMTMTCSQTLDSGSLPRCNPSNRVLISPEYRNDCGTAQID